MKKKTLFFGLVTSVSVFMFVVILLNDRVYHGIRWRIGIRPPTIEGFAHQFYECMLIYHNRMDANIPNDSIIFLGDSLTQGLCVSSFKRGVNLGIGHDTTYGLYKRLPRYESLKNARIIVLSIGYNDLEKQDTESIMNNYSKIINYLNNNKNHIICSGILPIDQNNLKKSKRIREINTQISLLIKKHDNCYLLDTSSLADQAGELKKIYHEGDGVHLNANGNQVWIGIIENQINKIIKKP